MSDQTGNKRVIGQLLGPSTKLIKPRHTTQLTTNIQIIWQRRQQNGVFAGGSTWAYSL